MKIFKTRNRRITSALIISAVLAVSTIAAAATGAGTELYHKIVDYGNGMVYNNVVSENDNGRQESNFTELKPGSVQPVVFADDTIYGKLTIDQVAEYAEGQGYQVLGGINTDFFTTKYGVPMGIVVEDGVYKSSPEGYNSICFDEEGNAEIVQNTAVRIEMANLGGAGGGTENAGEGVMLTHYNKMRTNSAGLYLYDEHFSTVSTRTSGDGWYVKFKILDGTMSTNGTVTLQVSEKLKSSYPLDIGEGYMVLTAGEDSNLDVDYDKFDVGDVVELTTYSWGNETVANAEWATGAGDLIVDNGQVTDSSTWDQALININPRSAFGIKADGTLVFYTVDGRQDGYSTGLTMQELAEEMVKQGCVQAVNLDGGGSSAMTMQLPGESQSVLRNSPSDGTERKCSTYVFFVATEESDGVPKNLYMANNGAVVYTGASFGDSYTATDKANQPATVPSDVTAEVTSGPASIANGIFTAGDSPGYADVSLSSASTGAAGTSRFLVTDTVTSLSVKCGTMDVTSGEIRLKKGEYTDLTPSDEYYGRPVITDNTSFSWSSSGTGGSIDSNGHVTAGDKTSETYFTVSSGGLSNTVKLIIEGTFSDTTLHWADSFIQDLYDRNIVSGIGDDLFGPDMSIRRCDFMVMLYRAAGSPAVTGSSSFDDVDSSAYYADAVSWAESQDIAAGNGTDFMPEDTLTREQAFAFVYRYITEVNGTQEVQDSVLDQFSDSDQIADYARTAAAALVSDGIVSGSDGEINPSGELSRAQMSRILDSTLSYLEN
ncbi:MAG: phosphodiester glycosidase family protein [Anaerovoracaceae bacterium]